MGGMETFGRRGVILVGASTGMGAALARLLAGRGWRAAIVARREDQLERLCRELNTRHPDTPGGPVALVYPHDTTHYDEAPALFERIRQDLGAAGSELELLVYAAGIMPRGEQGAWTF